MSCSSRAMRARSSATAARALTSRSSSSRSARSRSSSVCRERELRKNPTNQAAMKKPPIHGISPSPLWNWCMTYATVAKAIGMPA